MDGAIVKIIQVQKFGEFVDQLKDYQLLKHNSPSCIYTVMRLLAIILLLLLLYFSSLKLHCLIQIPADPICRAV
jgi:hypothetical protein